MTELATGRLRSGRHLGAGRLAGKRTLITGAAGNVGMGLVQGFLAEGAQVLAADLAVFNDFEVRPTTGNADALLTIRLDVTDPADWNRALALIISEWGGIDVLVNNAAIASALVPIDAREPEDWDQMMAINLRGPFLGTRAVIPPMRDAGGGAIVNLSSVAGLAQSRSMDAAYAASKAGLAMLTRVTAAQHGADGIRCNSVHPGPIDSAMMRAAYPDPETLAKRLSRVPMGRAASIAEVVAATIFLASDESSFTTGTAIGVDGGAIVE